MRPLAVAALLVPALWLPSAIRPAPVHAAVCTGWSSTVTPPTTIRVLRTGTGIVDTVDFETYVKVVMPAEWPSSWPIEALRAGAVAIEQYGWYYAMHWRGGSGTGGCYDVYDNSNDQVYNPSLTIYPSHVQAVESTWGESITKNGTFVFTTYRPGTTPDVCGSGYDGIHLVQHGARGCAVDGKTGEQILDAYYGPGLVINDAPTAPGPPTNVLAVPYDAAAEVSWTAPATDGRLAVTAYTVTSAPDGRSCVTSALVCQVAGLKNGTDYTFTVAATNSVGTGPSSGPSASITPAVLTGATYHPLAPTRMVDTRNGTGLSGALSSRVARSFQVTGGTSGVPAGATAVTGNLTVTQQTDLGYFYIGPNKADNPGSSTLNFPKADDRANAVTVALGPGGVLWVTYASTPGSTAQVIFDVTGFFTPDMTGSTYHAVAPTRLLDSRNGTGGPTVFSSHIAQSFQVTGSAGGVPVNAIAVTGNLTVTRQTSLGYLYIGPDRADNPTSSTLNFPLGDDRANAVTVALGAGGVLWVTYAAPVSGPTAQVIFDVTGYFTADATGATYVPVTPARLLDSRTGIGLSGTFSSRQARTFQVIGVGVLPAGSIAVTGNLTVTQQGGLGYLYAGPDPVNNPASSTLNFPKGDDRANAVSLALGSGGTLSVTYAGPAPGYTTHVVFDVTGYFCPPT